MVETKSPEFIGTKVRLQALMIESRWKS